MTLGAVGLGYEPYGLPTSAQQIEACILVFLHVGALLYGLLALTTNVEGPSSCSSAPSPEQ